MNNIPEQLQNYISQQRSAGVSDDQIRQTLIQNNWDPAIVNQALTGIVGASAHSKGSKPNKHKVRNGVLWMLSPIYTFFIIIIINIIASFGRVDSPIFSSLIFILGMGGIILTGVGPIIGIMILVRKD